MTAGILLVAIGSAVFVASVTHEAPMGHFNGHMGTLQPDSGKPDNVPTFATHGQAGCSPLKRGELVDTVLVVTQDGEARRMGFDEAWDRGHNDSWADDVWTIGVC